jgi:mono/diheme cytochrome c family protein
MFNRISVAAAGLVFALGIGAGLPMAHAASNDVERGRYLVEEVAKCGDCHTPLEKGEPDRAKWLQGAMLPFAPVGPVPDWRKMAPDLTPRGRLFQRWGEKALVKFLETGKGPQDRVAGPPMPAYHMKEADAEAIVEYLKSLK